jgi:transcriptional regulator with XRE-family HTH domain
MIQLDEEKLFSMIASAVKAERTKMEKSQEELAKMVDLDRSTITNIEVGRQKITLPVLYSICAALKLELTSVLPSIEDVIKKEQLELNESISLTSVTPMLKQALLEIFEDKEEK